MESDPEVNMPSPGRNGTIMPDITRIVTSPALANLRVRRRRGRSNETIEHAPKTAGAAAVAAPETDEREGERPPMWTAFRSSVK